MSAPVDFTDTVPAKGQSTKTVEGRLMVTLRNLAVTEGNLHLFSTLKKLGLSTNDVTHFVAKQTIHKKVVKEIDNKVRMSAMTSKSRRIESANLEKTDMTISLAQIIGPY